MCPCIYSFNSFDTRCFEMQTTKNVPGNWAQSSTTARTPSNDDGFPRNSSVPNFAAQKQDPFASLAGAMGAGLATSWNGTPRESNTPQSSSPAAAGTSVFQRNFFNLDFSIGIFFRLGCINSQCYCEMLNYDNDMYSGKNRK